MATIKHIKMTAHSDHVIKNEVFIEGKSVTCTYFTRRFDGVLPSPKGGYLTVKFPGKDWLVTNNQDDLSGEIYIVDSVDGTVPKTLDDLASMIADLIKA